MNGSPKTSVNTAVNTVLKHPPGKTRVYLQKTGYTREIPGSASMPRAPYSQGPCATCGAHRLLKYAHRTMCARYKCQKRHGLQVAVRTMRSCRHSASSATLWAGGSTGESTRWRSGRRAPSLRTPLATPRGRACHRSTRLLLASTPYRTPPTSAPAVCIACSCVPLHSGARRPACMQHKHTAHRCRSSRCGQSQHTAQRVRGRVAGVTTLWTLVIRATRPHLTERVNTSRGAVLTRLNTSTAVVLTVNV